MDDPTPSELAILQVVWQLGECRVQDVNDELNRTRETGYTTTLKLMQIMTDKGLLSRRKDGRSHLYQATMQEQKTKSGLLDRLVNRVFGGSRSSAVMQLLGSSDVTEQELAEIQKFLNDKKKNNSPKA